MTWTGRWAVVGIFAFAELSMSEIVAPWLGLPALLVAIVVAWQSVPALWKMALGGLIGGLIAGTLILGPGFRVAMRVVALMDPTLETEFTIGGTFFLVIGIGSIMGGLTALSAHLLRRVFEVRSSVVAGSLLGLYTVGSLLVFSSDIRQEFFDLGAGAWINIPMFTVFAVAFGIAAMALADKLEVEMFTRRDTVKEKVPA